MAPISSHQSGITRQELQEAIPDSLLSKNVHLHWIDKSPSKGGFYTLTAKIEIDGQMLLLRSKTRDTALIEDWDMNQPIIINDLFLQIAAVEGVQNVTDLKVFNRYGFKDGSDYEDYLYDIEAATENGIIYPSIDPNIFELRYPEKDIIGSAKQ